MTPHIRKHGVLKVAQYVKDYWYLINDMEMLEQLRDYIEEDQTKFDLVVAMMMTEIADDDLFDKQVLSAKKSEALEPIGWYRDHNGYKVYGIIPEHLLPRESEFPTLDVSRQIDYIDLQQNKTVYR